MRKLFVVLILLSLWLLQCARNEPPRILRIGTPDALETLDPHKRNATGSLNIIRQMYQALVTRDRNMRLLPGLAESWENPKTNLWRFRLRRGVLFHNGHQLDAYDVEATFRRLKENPHLEMASFASHISHLKVINSHTIEMTTNRLSIPALSRLLFIYIVPKNYKDYEGKWDSISAGTGPYRFVSRDGTRVCLKYFEQYWGPKPDFEEMEFFIQQNPSMVLGQLQDRKLECAKLDDFSLSDRMRQDYDLRITESLFVVYLGLSNKNSIFADREIRRTLAGAVNRQQIVQLGRQGFATVTTQAVSPYVYGFDPQIAPHYQPLQKPSFPPHETLRFIARQMFSTTAQTLQNQFRQMGLKRI